MSETTALVAGPGQAPWMDSSARAVLQLMVESVAEMVGFEVAALSVVVDEELVTVAYTGPEEHRAYIEERDPASIIAPLLARATPWGPRLRFFEAAPPEELEGHWVEVEQVPEPAPVAYYGARSGEEAPAPWRPDEALLAVLSADDGAVIGLLSVDRPSTGRHPDQRQRSLLERYAAQAERAVLTLIEHGELVQQVAHAEAARQSIRAASRPTHGSLEDVLNDSHGPLVAGFAARGSWLQVFGDDGPGVGVVGTHDGERLQMAPEIVDHVARAAPRLWAEQRCVVLTAETGAEDLPESVLQHLRERGLASILAVALGVGEQCVGFLALSRDADQPAWSAAEIDSALRLGHDLGAALMIAQALEGQRRLVAELQEVNDYQSQLVATLAHELRTPLTVIAGNLELLGSLDLQPQATRHREAMERGVDRMRRVVDDLLLLARVSNPQHPLAALPIDLRLVAADVAQLMEASARAGGVTLSLELGEGDLVVAGDPAELDRLVDNLVSNAVKYTQPGGRVRLAVRRCGDEVELSVVDDGLGISEADQPRLFQAFFRTSNPEALRRPGTGLGLAIVASVVERHGGRIEVRSRLGEGTAFTVTLPAR